MTPKQIAALVGRLFADLNSRKGFDTRDLDDETRRQWRRDWVSIIAGELMEAGIAVKFAKTPEAAE